MSPLNALLLGATGMASLVAASLFARFWRRTRDRFFLLFAASFALEGVNGFLMGVTAGATEDGPFYLIRATSFLLILLAIVQKNRGGNANATRDIDRK